MLMYQRVASNGWSIPQKIRFVLPEFKDEDSEITVTDQAKTKFISAMKPHKRPLTANPQLFTIK